MKKICITIDEKTLEKLDKQAESQERTRSAHIRRLVKDEEKRDCKNFNDFNERMKQVPQGDLQRGGFGI